MYNARELQHQLSDSGASVIVVLENFVATLAELTLIPNPRDFGGFIATLKRRPFHMLPGVNTLFNALLSHPQFNSVDFSSLCATQAGGMAASEGTAQRWLETSGCPMVEGRGMSETCAIGTNNPVLAKAVFRHGWLAAARH